MKGLFILLSLIFILSCTTATKEVNNDIWNGMTVEEYADKVMSEPKEIEDKFDEEDMKILLKGAKIVEDNIIYRGIWGLWP